MSANRDDIERAIAVTREGLAAAGFDIEVLERDGRLVFAVQPRPDACAECLVPKAVFEDILDRELADGGIQVAGFELVYPLDED